MRVSSTKIYISQPTSNRTLAEIEGTKRVLAEKALKRFGDIEILETKLTTIPDEANSLWLLSKSLETMSQADVVYFANGWEKSKRCRIENQCAMAYGLNIIEVYSERSGVKAKRN
jgi:hypothetical protein